MKPPPFTYLRPATLPEALRFLAAHPDEAKPLAGGQSLMPMLNMRLARPDYLVDIGRLPELAGLAPGAGGGLELGALVLHRDLATAALVRERAPLLAECAPLIGHPAIRNRGTLGGSIAHADPAAELPAALVALDATVRVAGAEGTREIAASAFFLDVFTTALQPGELVVGVHVPAAPAHTGWAVVELARRLGDYALAGAAVRLTLDAAGRCAEARIVLLGVSGAPYRARAAEDHLRGQAVTESPSLAAEAARRAAATLDPPGDLHASGAYRAHIAGVCVERALATAQARGTTC